MLNFLFQNIDWVAMLFLYAGFIQTTRLKRDAWIWLSIACGILGIVGFIKGLYGLGIGEMIFIPINIYGYVSWKRKQIKRQMEQQMEQVFSK